MKTRGPYKTLPDGRIDCEIEIDGGWHPFTADADDPDPTRRPIARNVHRDAKRTNSPPED